MGVFLGLKPFEAVSCGPLGRSGGKERLMTLAKIFKALIISNLCLYSWYTDKHYLVYGYA